MTDAFLDIIPCGYFSFSDDGNIIEVNETACSMLAAKPSGLMGKSVEDIFTIPTKIFFQTHFFPLVKMHGHAEEIYIDLVDRSGIEVPVLLNARRRLSQERYVTDCAFIVVHNRKKFEGELIAARKSAEKALLDNSDLIEAKVKLQEHAERLEEQLQIIARHYHDMQQINHAVTHNLKEPLRKILMFAGKIRESQSSPDLQRLLRSSQQMKSVVSALQEYVWLDEKEKDIRTLQLQEVIGTAATKVKQENETVTLNIQCDELPVITGDKEQLLILFYHLLSNAVKFRKAAQVDVFIRSTVLKKNLFQKLPGKYSYQDFVKLEIQDNGKGFDNQYKEHVFELFRKLHFEEGQGIGLSLAKKVVQNHGGFIEAESVPGESTRLIVFLPLKQPDELVGPQ